MEDAILNSLLRYSKQLTPKRETYPIPSKEWTGGLRGVVPEVNLSTYYLLDNPSSYNSSVHQYKISSSMSTSAISPQKRGIKRLSPQKSTFSALNETEEEKKIAETESEIKKALEKEENERVKFNEQQRVFQNIKKALIEKKKNKETLSLQKDFDESTKNQEIFDLQREYDEYKRNQEILVEKMQEEILVLREKLVQSNNVIIELKSKLSD